jgi:hypothetical protein
MTEESPKQEEKRTVYVRIPKQFCKNGHALVSSNVYLRTDGRRQCRACKRQIRRDWTKKKRHDEQIEQIRARFPNWHPTEVEVAFYARRMANYRRREAAEGMWFGLSDTRPD